MLKTKMPKQKRSEKTRAKIIKAGIRLFSKDGYHSTSSKKIAREAGVAIGSFYNYFKDKKQLLFEIHALHANRVHKMIEKSMVETDFGNPDIDGKAVVQRIVKQALELHDYSPALHSQISALIYTDPDFAQMGREEDARAVELLGQLLGPQKDLLRVDDFDAAAIVVGQAIEGIVHSIKIFGAPIEEQRLTNALADMIYSYLYKRS